MRRVAQSPILTIDSDRVFNESAFGLRVADDVETQSAEISAENRLIEADLKAEERKLTDQTILTDDAGDHIRGVSLMRMFEYDIAFRDLIVREPFASLAEAILGEDCHCMSQNAWKKRGLSETIGKCAGGD